MSNQLPVNTSGQASEAVPVAINIRAALGKDAAHLLDGKWDALLSKQQIPNPTSSAAWLRATMQLDESSIPLVITAEIGQQIVGAGAFEIKSSKGIRVARWLGGSGRPAITPDLLIDPEYPEVATDIMAKLRAASDVVSLGPSRIAGDLGTSFDRQDKKVFAEKTAEAWIVALPAPKIEKLRKKNKTRLKRAERDGATIRINTYSETDTIKIGLERLFVLHQRRWKDRHDISRFSHNDFYRDWTRDLVVELAERDQVRIIEVLENGKPVAMILGFLFGRGALFHTPAVEPGGILKGAGHIAMQTWVEAAQNAGAEVMNLGRGSGEPQGPKGALGPTRHPCGIFKAGSSSPFQIMVSVTHRTRKTLHALNRFRAGLAA